VFDGAEAAEHRDDDGLDGVLQALADGIAAGRGFGAALDMTMTGDLIGALRSSWEGGWQPADIVRAAAKRLGRSHMDLAAEVIAVEARTSTGPDVRVPESWAEQLRQLPVASGLELRWSDPDRLRLGIGLLGMLIHLPGLPHLMPPPSKWGSRHGRPIYTAPPGTVDTRMLAKVRALLAKAESTTFEEEANALTAKAQELMARHAIDQAMVAGADGADSDGPTGRRIGVDDPYAGAKANLLHSVAQANRSATVGGAAGDGPGGRRIGIDDPYAHGRCTLLAHVAEANRCHTVVSDGYGFSTIFGFPDDLDIVEVLFTSLLVQATRAMRAAGSQRDSLGRSRTRSFRQSFFLAFAGRIGERLRVATTQATEDAGAVHGEALLPILAERRSAVEDAFRQVFPKLVSVSQRVSNYDGWVAGRVAADRAHLGPDQQLPPAVAV
jgi:Protein of unknown function (DUF2786)